MEQWSRAFYYPEKYFKEKSHCPQMPKCKRTVYKMVMFLDWKVLMQCSNYSRPLWPSKPFWGSRWDTWVVSGSVDVLFHWFYCFYLEEFCTGKLFLNWDSKGEDWGVGILLLDLLPWLESKNSNAKHHILGYKFQFQISRLTMRIPEEKNSLLAHWK